LDKSKAGNSLDSRLRKNDNGSFAIAAKAGIHGFASMSVLPDLFRYD
jgi:hypothetical protein